MSRLHLSYILALFGEGTFCALVSSRPLYHLGSSYDAATGNRLLLTRLPDLLSIVQALVL